MSNQEQKPLPPIESSETDLTQANNPQAKSEPRMHELQLQQLELEKQNETLRQAQLASEAAREHYLELYDFAPIGYIALTTDGNIAELNLCAAGLFGDNRAVLTSRAFADFIEDNYKERWHRFFRHILQWGEKRSCELLIRRVDDKLIHVQLDCQRTKPERHPPLLLIALNDITERKLAEEEQRVAAAAFEVQAGIIVMDDHKLILRVNWTFCQLTGYSADEVTGKDAMSLLCNDHHKEFSKNLWEIISIVGYWQGEIWLKRKNAAVFPAWFTLTAINAEAGHATHYVASLNDITAQKQAEKVLLDSHRCLLDQMVTTKQELVKTKEETAEINTTLSVLLKHRELDKNEAQVLLSRELETTVFPILDKLKKTCVGQFQPTHLIGIVEANLLNIVKTYGRSGNLAAAYQKLTPIEKQVASMVRQGLSTKMIAAALNISPGTVSSHRKHIRKKLDLDGKGANLSNYLASLSDENQP